MAMLKISHRHKTTPEEAKKRVSEIFTAYRSRFGIQHRWEGQKLILSGRTAEGEGYVGEETIELEVMLKGAAVLFQRQVESGIRSELEKRFG